MGIISADTFRPLRNYIGIRLQQGVPLVDADWNELEDVRRFEVRAFLKWFVGDGVPEGNDGFRIVGSGLMNDFTISAGAPPPVVSTDPVEHGLRDVGRILVDGRDVLIDAALRYRNQPLHTSMPGAAARAATLGVPVVPELPVMDGEAIVYLDVWDRLVTPSEDPSLVFGALGTESCARIKREWVVRVRAGTTAPQLSSPADPDFAASHSYYALARLLRRTSSGAVAGSDVTDLRARRLLLPPAHLFEDLFGTTADRYRRGLDRPALSLRRAINALLRGEIPSTADTPVSLDLNLDTMRRAFAFDPSNGLMAVWTSNRVGGLHQVFASRLDLGNVAAGFDAIPDQVTSGVEHTLASAAVLPNGELLITYQAGAPNSDVFYKRAPYRSLPGAPEQPVASSGAAESSPEVLISGDRAVFLFHVGGTNDWRFRRLRHVDSVWLDASPVQLSPQTTTVRDLHATVDRSTGRIWATFRAGVDLHALSLDPVTGVVSNHTPAALDSGGVDQQPFIVPTAAGAVWVFWSATGLGLRMARFASGSWGATQTVPPSASGDRNPTVVEDAEGGLWLFFTRGTPGRLHYVRREPAGGTWSALRQLSFPPTAAAADNAPYALAAPDGSTWIFWQSDRGGNTDVYFKQLITSI